MKQKIIFLLIMIALIAADIFVPWILAAIYDSKIMLLTFIPLVIGTMYVWVKGFDFII